MRIPGLNLQWTVLPGDAPVAIAAVGEWQWTEAARLAREGGGRLVSLWGADHRDLSEDEDEFSVYAAYAVQAGLAIVRLVVAEPALSYPDLSGLFPAAARMQRALFDLLGIGASGAADTRPWLRHGAWAEDAFPLRRDFDAAKLPPNALADYAFVRVEGDGVHEIPVGPIHAGIIEPGHFRFSIVGEKVLRLEARLGYVHKGIEKRFEDFTVAEGHRLAGRVSGDSTVAFAWAYAQAAESLLGVVPPPRARWIRALALERERVANHLGDLGALGNDAALAFALSQFMRLKEDWLRTSGEVFGHRLLMDLVVPGGVASGFDAAGAERMVAESKAIEVEVRDLRDIFDEHAGLQDRFLTTGRVTPELARKLGLTGLAGRASGQANDLRADFPAAPYAELAVRKAGYAAGDVAARVHLRFDEVLESLRLVRAIAMGAPDGELRVELPQPRAQAFGAGWVEGWRGEVLVALEAGEGGRIRRCHAHDPSWQNWPVIEHAVMGNIVPDFPLINKSFNLSYSGQDG
ncbi:MAG: NADH-quinone oxidoreductase subunit C [Betaproteobacteria bacterium]|nr:NADH-quinone oxidoreductase subunit C [Betaproteobacteria bacterium]